MNVQTQIKRTAAEEALLAAFAERGTKLPGDAKVAERREEAVLLLQRGLPNRKVEAWHYTDLRRLLSAVPSFDAGGPAAPRAPLLEGSFVLPVLNGVATPPLAIDGVAVSKVADRLADGSLAPLLRLEGSDDTVSAINAAFAADGFVVDVPAGAEVAAPIELQNIQAGGQVHTRFAVTVGEGAKATFVERQAGEGDAFVSSVSHLQVEDDAEVLWLILQEQPEGANHLGRISLTMGKRAKVTLFVMNSGGKLVRQELRIVAEGEGSELRLRGVNLLAGDTHCDVTMVLDHAAPHTVSTETIRNVVTGRAEGAFQGQIRVARHAQKTDAKMACNTLLLSDEGGFSAKPELEIFADDVACGHGATVTEIEADHLFYLMARGIDEKTARGLLVKAFLAEVVEELENEQMVDALEARLNTWFAEHG
ncbi:Fe-S cluster assembly protein SufD [Chelativorans sp. SCAU2101]|uniref:Fe-S cluster assembly protein SufD n=1 Tax=Chelativorans petroleitrophicus TaxID=2975484 RepID=A0A9X2X767_9HYPH|nr:Fe-S cluster assembly protein SufD [Chelativorans petroleitrophicus]MCT8989381.1 Fe-S cluster assembly protein SufD [Chelativorans petroleitrophicus]